MLAADAPLRDTVVPAPLPAGVTVPEMLNVGTALAVKLTALTFAPLTVTGELAGVNAKPGFEGVTVYEPLAKFENVYLPAESAVTVALPAPDSVTRVLAPLADGLMVPEILNVDTGEVVKTTSTQ